jgi:hypothetical protein
MSSTRKKRRTLVSSVPPSIPDGGVIDEMWNEPGWWPASVRQPNNVP